MLLRNLQGGHFYWDTVYLWRTDVCYSGYVLFCLCRNSLL